MAEQQDSIHICKGEITQRRKARSSRKRKSGRMNQLNKARAAKRTKNINGFTDIHQEEKLQHNERHILSSEQNEENTDLATPTVDPSSTVQSRSTEKLLKNLDSSFLDENMEHEFGFHFFDIQLLSFAIAKPAVCRQQNPNYNTQNPKISPGLIFWGLYSGRYLG